MDAVTVEQKQMPGPAGSALQQMSSFGGDPLAYFEHLAALRRLC